MDLLVTFDNTTGTGDYAIAAGDLTGDDTLSSDVILSVMTDRLANASDTLPDGGTDRRGFWGDTALPLETGDAPPDLIGSRFWLLANALQTLQTLRAMRVYGIECVTWMVEDGIAAAVDCQPRWTGIGSGVVQIIITRMIAGKPVNTTYDFAWANTMGLTPLPQPTAGFSA